MSERLEKIQQESITDAIEWGCQYGSRSQVKTDKIVDDVNWLIGQAEEKERLKEQLDKAETLIKKIYRIAGASAEVDVKLWKETEEYLGGKEKALKALEESK